MKCSQLLKQLKEVGWFVAREGKGSHKILEHHDHPGKTITFPDHGSAEIGKGLAEKIKKKAGLK
jgi:predicted RNA binding protein YcfA (HicA-like mRNA interferase family)